MQLKNNVLTDDGWQIAETHFDPGQLVTTGSNTMIGNGYLGYRGTFSEWRRDRYVACIVTDTWDTAPGGRWRELCNVPNGLYTTLAVAGTPLSIFAEEQTRDYRRALDLRHGLFSRAQTFQAPGGAARVTVERFASMANVHLLAQRYRVEAKTATTITLSTGIDGNVWSLNGDHFREQRLAAAGDLLAAELVTHEFGTPIAVVEAATLTGREAVAPVIQQNDGRLLRVWTLTLQPGEAVTLEKVVAIYHGNDVIDGITVHDPLAAATGAARDALASGYDALKSAHAAAWDAIWAQSNITIDGDLEAQTLARFNLYHNLIATPRHANLPIGARGLSCQVYQGAAFWDQELFNLPMFTTTQPEMARRILTYRHDTLDGARGKARRLGYYGAFYAWTSGKTGEELFPDIFFTDVLTGRPIRNHFNCWQIHISPDIVYAIRQYVEATGDWDYVTRYGAEIAFEVAQFLVARAHFKRDKNRYELIRLLGPDEYHENVDNNAFTLHVSRLALDTALWFHQTMQTEEPTTLAALLDRLGLDEGNVADWQHMADHLYLPQPDPASGVIEQFDGYFALEDVTPAEVRARLIDPEEYWGWPNGVAVRTQVLKQADVLQLLAIKGGFDEAVLRANFDYYEPRTEHGSSLSPAVHALVACLAGYEARAYEYFLTAATIDLYNASQKVMSGGEFLGGIHTAAAGGVWQIIVQGFAGFQADNTGVSFTPRLPQGWERLAFHITHHGQRLAVTITPEAVTVLADPDNAAPVAVTVGGQTRPVEAGARAAFAR